MELPDGIHEHLHRDAFYHRADNDGPVHDGDGHDHGMALAVGDRDGDDHGRTGERVPVRLHVLELRRFPALPDGLQLVRILFPWGGPVDKRALLSVGNRHEGAKNEWHLHWRYRAGFFRECKELVGKE